MSNQSLSFKYKWCYMKKKVTSFTSTQKIVPVCYLKPPSFLSMQ